MGSSQSEMIRRTSLSFGAFLACGFGLSYYLKYYRSDLISQADLEWIPDALVTHQAMVIWVCLLWPFTHLMRDCLEKHKYPFLLMMMALLSLNALCTLRNADYDWMLLGAQLSWMAGIGWKLIQRALKTSYRMTQAQALAD